MEADGAKQFAIAFSGYPKGVFDIIKVNHTRTKLADDKRIFHRAEPLKRCRTGLHEIAAETLFDIGANADPLPFNFSKAFLFGGWPPFHLRMLAG